MSIAASGRVVAALILVEAKTLDSAETRYILGRLLGLEGPLSGPLLDEHWTALRDAAYGDTWRGQHPSAWEVTDEWRQSLANAKRAWLEDGLGQGRLFE